MSAIPSHEINYKDSASTISILCKEASYFSYDLSSAILEVFKSEIQKAYRAAVKNVDWHDPSIRERIDEVVSMCEQEVKTEYDEFVRILKDLKIDPSQIYNYFYRLEDLYVQNIRVAEIGYIIGVTDTIE
ncbi:hypothetical protein M5X06_16045 [Paenibacillus alvei]|uniref:Uncharacterized protein n=1 Tax=Paenibacillus alvei TaxID=44250 RepID=A0ABT4GQQ7_PAEAL|nr:hypothetical protein [Paenibacillus alvei]MCY9759004.1 hypothetical protein [Paenibacillus alvei]MCY9768331.1 hypothetical protein [Paenibacillus alvei]